MGSQPKPCARCGRRRPHLSRRLCSPCYYRARHHGELIDYERVKRPLIDTIDDYRVLRALGTYTKREIAARLGMSFAALNQALVRARRRGLLERAS